MGNKILVTDSLFIFDEHVKRLKDAGYEVERLDKPEASEDELCRAIKGKVGYILGGIEKVTDKVIEAADELKCIAFTGADWKALIPGWERAAQKAITITSTPGGNTFAVAEYSLAMALAMQRNLFELGRTGDKTFFTSKSLQDSVVGVLGTGHVGQKIINQVKTFGVKGILYFSRTKKDCGATYTELDQLLARSDVIFLAVPGTAGQLIDKAAISKMQQNALLVSISPQNVIDFDSLLKRLKTGEIRAAVDWPGPSVEFNELPLSVWYGSNSHTAYNTEQTLQRCSDMAVQSLINILSNGQDEFVAN